jgi:nucleoside-diphosphate-sugar epimerase
MSNPLVLVTGANGFVGGALCEALARQGRTVRRAVRTPANDRGEAARGMETMAVGSISAETDWSRALEGVDTVFHLAAHAHAMHKGRDNTLAQYRRINVEGTERLARMAIDSRVRRLVCMSSIKVNGESTHDRPFTELDAPRPEDPYGISKWEAEQALWRATAGSGTEAVVLRPPLVYGPGVKGNFLRLLRAIERGWPLPLASVRNRRSMIYLGNLVDAVLACLDAPRAGGKTYLVSDGEDVSTPELLRAVAATLNVRPRLVPCPVSLLGLAAGILGKRDEVQRLTGSLQVDSSRIRSELGWQPRYSFAQGLAETARWYHALAHHRPPNKSA